MISALTKRVNFARASALLPSKRDYCIRSVFVGNLPWKVTGEDLKKHFSQFGTVYATYVPFLKEGNNKGFGFVRFIVGEHPGASQIGKEDNATPEEIEECTRIVEEAARKANGAIYGGKTIRVQVSTNEIPNPNPNPEQKSNL